MSLPTEQHKFILQDDGKIYLMDGDSVIEVSNQDEVKAMLCFGDWKYLLPGKRFSLLCSVEKFTGKCKDICKYCRIHGCEISETVALVTFSKPEEKETQEELWDDIFNGYTQSNEDFEIDGEKIETYHPLEFKEYLKKYYNVPTRKEK